jgi:hypothetical protein
VEGIYAYSLKVEGDCTSKIGLRGLVGGIFMDIKWPPNILRNFLQMLYDEQRKRKLLEF